MEIGEESQLFCQVARFPQTRRPGEPLVKLRKALMNQALGCQMDGGRKESTNHRGIVGPGPVRLIDGVSHDRAGAGSWRTFVSTEIRTDRRRSQRRVTAVTDRRRSQRRVTAVTDRRRSQRRVTRAADDWRRRLAVEIGEDSRFVPSLFPVVYTLAQVGAMVAMRVEDNYARKKRSWPRLDDKSGKQPEMPEDHTRQEDLDGYFTAAGIADDRKGSFFGTAPGHQNRAEPKPMRPADVRRMSRRRLKQAHPHRGRLPQLPGDSNHVLPSKQGNARRWPAILPPLTVLSGLSLGRLADNTSARFHSSTKPIYVNIPGGLSDDRAGGNPSHPMRPSLKGWFLGGHRRVCLLPRNANVAVRAHSSQGLNRQSGSLRPSASGFASGDHKPTSGVAVLRPADPVRSASRR